MSLSSASKLELQDYPTSADIFERDIESTDTAEANRNGEQKGSQKAQPAKDPDVVDWEGPADPANPRNWKRAKKLTHVALISGFTLYANLASVMFAPGATALCAEFGITSSVTATFTVSVYLLGFAIGPLIIASLSELYGRLIVYHVCNVIYLLFTLGCALSTNTAMFMAFRFITGCAASAPMAIGGGTIPDLYVPDERGKAMALYGMGPLLGPVIGPIVGGYVTQDASWRWTFWIILILACLIVSVSFGLMRETYENTLLERKTAYLRRATGNQSLQARTHDRNSTPSQLVLRAIVRPTKILLLSPIVLMMSVYAAFMYGLIFLLFATFPVVFEEQYHFSTGASGLVYIGLGLGMILGIVCFAILSDKLLKQPRGGTVKRPELRLILMIWVVPIFPIGFFWYGWSTENGNPWIVPILATFFIGFAAFMMMMPGQIYLVDAFGTEAAASAMAAGTVLRSLAAGLLPLAGLRLYDQLGLGWGNSVLGFLALAFVPVPALFYKYGEYLRTRFPVHF